MKTPVEIKKNLARCLDRWTSVRFESCESNCPYHSEGTLCKETLHLDVLTYIQQLEETIGSLGHLNATMYNEAKKGIEDLEKRLAQAERERDAAVLDLKSVDEKYESLKSMIDDVIFNHEPYGLYLNFREAADAMVEYEHADVWRGVCPENTEVD